MFSFTEEESNEIMRCMNNTDIDMTPPPLKRARTEEMPSSQSSNSTISLSTFLTTPHFTTKNNTVEVLFNLFFYKNLFI